jgi:hypothetical protein
MREEQEIITLELLIGIEQEIKNRSLAWLFPLRRKSGWLLTGLVFSLVLVCLCSPNPIAYRHIEKSKGKLLIAKWISHEFMPAEPIQALTLKLKLAGSRKEEVKQRKVTKRKANITGKIANESIVAGR